jgi:Uma2 family endonuclease
LKCSQSYDRGAKFELYRQIPSLEEYVLVSQREPIMETFLRRPEGAWLFRASKGAGADAALQSLELIIPLAEIYDGIEFKAVPPAPKI